VEETYMKIPLTALTIMLLLGASACGSSGGAGDSTGDNPSNRSVTVDREQVLRDQFEQVSKALKEKDFTRLYSLTTEEFRSKCSLGDFMGAMQLAQSVLGESFFKADRTLSNVAITGDTASYFVITKLNGVEVLPPAPETFHWQGGKWIENDIGDTSICTGK
jgi:hypothetical protein